MLVQNWYDVREKLPVDQDFGNYFSEEFVVSRANGETHHATFKAGNHSGKVWTEWELPAPELHGNLKENPITAWTYFPEPYKPNEGWTGNFKAGELAKPEKDQAKFHWYSVTLFDTGKLLEFYINTTSTNVPRWRLDDLRKEKGIPYSVVVNLCYIGFGTESAMTDADTTSELSIESLHILHHIWVNGPTEKAKLCMMPGWQAAFQALVDVGLVECYADSEGIAVRAKPLRGGTISLALRNAGLLV